MKRISLSAVMVVFLLTAFIGSTGYDNNGYGLLNAEQQSVNLWKRDTLTGDWGGFRSRLAEQGVYLEIVYTGEMASISNGGIRKKTVYLDNKDIVLSIDAEELVGWRGAEFSLYVLGNHGDSPSEHIGDLQVFSNIDTDAAWKIYEAWIQQSFFNNRLSLKFGLYDLNSEFDVIEACGVFHNSSFGIGPDYSQSGVNGPSIFSTTSLGLRLRIEPKEGYYAQAVVLDGVPGDPDNPKGTHIILKKDDGLLFSGEIGYLSDKGFCRKLALGGWYYTSDTPEIAMEDHLLETRKNSGFYALAEQQLFKEKGEGNQGLVAFLRLGTADMHVNQLDFYLGVGMVYTGLIPGRDDDQFGIGVAYAHNGKSYMDMTGQNADTAETVLEVVYHFQATPWLALMPEIQYIMNPGTLRELENALVFAIRSEISF